MCHTVHDETDDGLIEKLKELWVILIWFITITGTLMVTGWVLGWTFRLRKSQRSFINAAMMFMNSNLLPAALMQSLVAGTILAPPIILPAITPLTDPDRGEEHMRLLVDFATAADDDWNGR
ncbi:hypothetical protein CVT25_007701 [Psilocybe cyanescens]|uniref:Uncharacterized protein n=1 Tax=Psilocybe cyanescens TaxID=93625 RepID=A0A409XVK0_PSICY|nr:hypothetical protein CVT25_007701 [Psilocybe cyanescens]